MDRRGFTIIEVIMVIVLISVLGASASLMFYGGTSSLGVSAAARKVADDIRYAQSLAMARTNLDTPNLSNPSFTYRIRFNVADANCSYSSRYTIVSDADNDGTWGERPNGAGVVESARDPATGTDYFCVQFDTGDYAGFALSADFGGSSAGILEFDPYGIPYDNDGARLASAKSVVVSKAGQSATVVVTPNTGMVAVQ
jgi:prepilin-type N-terminal cleavage/methylation domain-containing protein